MADLDVAIERWHRAWGVGPFFVRRHLELARVTHRGQPITLDFSVAYVQSGEIMVELVEQHDAQPSAFRDMFDLGEQGFHHVAILPDDYASTLDYYASIDCPVAMEMRTASDRGAALIDTRALCGHMTEVYLPSAGLGKVYSTVAEAARHWDGQDLKIEVNPRA